MNKDFVCMKNKKGRKKKERANDVQGAQVAGEEKKVRQIPEGECFSDACDGGRPKKRQLVY